MYNLILDDLNNKAEIIGNPITISTMQDTPRKDMMENAFYLFHRLMSLSSSSAAARWLLLLLFL